MIIDRCGNIISAFSSFDGIVVHDKNFAICLEYREEDKSRVARIDELKDKLRLTDFKAIKYSEGCYTEEEYAAIRKERQEMRDEINALQVMIKMPTITRQEMDAAEARALELLKEERESGGVVYD